MKIPYSISAGKALKRIASLRGGGSALPGLFIEKINPSFVTRALESLPRGVVIVSGTNGKTTTTKMIVSLLESQGLEVFTNRTGSNFVRGVAAALLGEVDSKGKLSADIAILELDEAHATHFVEHIKPTYSLLLNVMRDQLDRFGEIDSTAKLLRTIAAATTDGIIINRDDPRLIADKFIDGLDVPVTTYGVSDKLALQFPSDDTMRSNSPSVQQFASNDDTALIDIIDGSKAIFGYNNKSHEVTLQLRGLYNIQNAAGAIALCRAVMGEALNEPTMLEALSNVKPAFGRGESITVDGQPIELVLVKNPSGFRLSLSSFSPAGYATMIAINDAYADGRDMSWLWDVNFDSLSNQGIAMVSGVRAYDMALRLQYDEISIDSTEPQLGKALHSFIAAHPDKPKRIFCSYTAMLSLRRALSKIGDVEKIR